METKEMRPYLKRNAEDELLLRVTGAEAELKGGAR